MIVRLKKGIKKIFDRFGYEIHRKNYNKDFRTSMADVCDNIAALGLNPKTVIDVGVAKGTAGLYEKFLQSKFLLIEPLAENEESLKEICASYNAEYVLAAAGPRQGSIIINAHPSPDSSSLLNEVEGKHVDGVPRKIPMVSIDDLCRQKKLIGPYLIKVDVQGAELLVLDGAQETLVRTEVVILETQLFQFFMDGPQFYDVVEYMKKRGFVVYDIFGNLYRPLDKALGAVDLVFVKEKGMFRKSHDFADRKEHIYS